MRPISPLPAFLLCLGLTACKPQSNSATSSDGHPHAVRGSVDSAKALTLEEIAKLSLEEAKARYLGKVVTFKGVNPAGVSAKNEERSNVCMQGFGKWFTPHIGPVQRGDIYVYFNFGDEITKWDHEGEYRPDDLKVDHLLVLDEDVCDTARVCNEMDAQSERKCTFATDRLLLAGKVIAVRAEEEGRGLSIDLRPTGIRY
jgi:hypothetical protein